MKTHLNWVFTAALLAFALEGCMGTVGETLANTLGMSKANLGVLCATVIGWAYSALYNDSDHPSHHHRPPRARPKAVRRPPKSH